MTSEKAPGCEPGADTKERQPHYNPDLAPVPAVTPGPNREARRQRRRAIRATLPPRRGIDPTDPMVWAVLEGRALPPVTPPPAKPRRQRMP